MRKDRKEFAKKNVFTHHLPSRLVAYSYLFPMVVQRVSNQS